jgi:hypothetical protein
MPGRIERKDTAFRSIRIWLGSSRAAQHNLSALIVLIARGNWGLWSGRSTSQSPAAKNKQQEKDEKNNPETATGSPLTVPVVPEPEE